MYALFGTPQHVVNRLLIAIQASVFCGSKFQVWSFLKLSTCVLVTAPPVDNNIILRNYECVHLTPLNSSICEPVFCGWHTERPSDRVPLEVAGMIPSLTRPLRTVKWQSNDAGDGSKLLSSVTTGLMSRMLHGLDPICALSSTLESTGHFCLWKRLRCL